MFCRKKLKNLNIKSFCHSRGGGNPVCRIKNLDSRLHGNDIGEVDDRGHSNKGFSLVELMVVIGIFALISGVVVFDYGRFSSNLIVTNLAYEGALAVRQAQVYGISVKQTKAAQGTGGVSLDASYGVWFENPASGGLNQNFYLFADAVGGTTNKFDRDINGNNIEEEESFSMNGSNTISKFCVTNSGATSCSSDGRIDSISIIFKRPEPNAKIYAYKGETTVVNGGSKAEIIFTSGRGDKKARMTVTSTGQISVDSCNKAGDDSEACN
jgi:prepilin-type N-terminal cleavage/methylation domain-containing protein